MPIMNPGTWLPDTNPLPFPDCSVVTHSKVLMSPTSLTLEVEGDQESSSSSSSVCDDPTFLQKVDSTQWPGKMTTF